MRCPVDQSDVRWIGSTAPSFSKCGQCAGLWISRRAIEELFTRRGHAIPLRINLARRRGLLFKIGARVCPGGCGEQMMVATLHGIEIDVCPKCGGVWFDEGELPNLLKWYGAQRSKVLSQPVGAARSDGNPVVDLAFDVADGVVTSASSELLGSVVEAVGEFIGAVISGIDL